MINNNGFGVASASAETRAEAIFALALALAQERGLNEGQSTAFATSVLQLSGGGGVKGIGGGGLVNVANSQILNNL